MRMERDMHTAPQQQDTNVSPKDSTTIKHHVNVPCQGQQYTTKWDIAKMPMDIAKMTMDIAKLTMDIAKLTIDIAKMTIPQTIPPHYTYIQPHMSLTSSGFGLLAAGCPIKVLSCFIFWSESVLRSREPVAGKYVKYS